MSESRSGGPASGQSTTPLERILLYHDATKHHPQRYARSLGYLDWATQPNPFRRFEGADVLPLVVGERPNEPPYNALYQPGSVEPQPLNRRFISQLFECSLGLSAWKEFRGSRWALRCNPSSGNLHPTEGYLIAGPIDGLAEKGGVFHYAPQIHALERRAEFSVDAWNQVVEPFGASAFFLALSSIHWREAWKYGERAFRYCNHDVGHALAALRFACAMLGWRLTLLDDLGDDDVARLLGLDRVGDFDKAEPEHPDLIAVATPASQDRPKQRTFSDAAIEALAAARWTGRANQLSTDHVAWDIIDMAADAARKPRTLQNPAVGRASVPAENLHASSGVGRPSEPAPTNAPEGPTARQIILQRRSAVDFDGETPLPRDIFYSMLGRVMPCGSGFRPDSCGTGFQPVTGANSCGTGFQPNSCGTGFQPDSCGTGFQPVTGANSCGTGLQPVSSPHFSPPPWDTTGWPPRIHLLLFVHRVTGLPPGLYFLLRDPAILDSIRSAARDTFDWSRPPECPADLPLYFLMEADCRRAAADLSLGQAIAGDSAFSLGMIAEFEQPLRTVGPWLYRRLFWEAGMVGQVLYLEAEAAGVALGLPIRATGIGAYFDDPVHEVLGLPDRRFQSLYHFTIGGAVEDTRLTTLPPYGPDIVSRR